MAKHPVSHDRKALRRMIADDDMGALADEAVNRAGATRGHWTGEWTRFHQQLRAMPAEQRRRFAEALVERYPSLGPRLIARLGVLLLVTHVTLDLPGDYLGEERRAALDEIGRQRLLPYPHQVEVLARAELAAGRALRPAVAAAFRRSAPTELLKLLAEPVLSPGEPWAERALEEVTDKPDDPWHALLTHALAATTAKPGVTWDKRARELVEPLGADRVRDTVLPWLALAGRPRTIPLDEYEWQAGGNEGWDPHNATALRGLAWLLALLPAHPDTARALGALVETALKKVPGLGPRNPKVANAGVVALARIDSEQALGELARLAARVTYKNTAKLIDGALSTRAEALGLTREEVEELAVPAYGLTEVGAAEHLLGEVTAELRVQGGKAVLAWRNAAGKTVKGVPAAVRRDHPEELKKLKAAVKDIDRMLTAQSERLDRQFLARRTWPYDAWRERYLDHPLVGTLARRLLWTVDGSTVGFADGRLRTLADEPVTAGAAVELWHPVGREPAEIVAWRDWLERHAITQPFKQAHREVYVLTDAERATGTYSNRFAAHILRQHQFHSLAAIRGWRNKLRLCVDDEAPPATRELPQWGLRAEYWIHGDGQEWGVDIADSQSYLRVSTDQVRFYPVDAPQNSAHCSGGEYHMGERRLSSPVESLPLAGIPPLVLSEVLRDVDLFVGVASVGNDPTWQDGGPDGRHRDYWASFGFGALSQTAETRRALLERLVPRLATADRCTVEGRFLHVKGERHTYRIHLGSGNILMSPHDQYLCIVPKPSAASAAPPAGYLPFEGDRTLAVILSKAMLLARDTEITDPTILSQL